MLEFIRIACAVPPVRVADVKKNAQDICDKIDQADTGLCDVVVFPELALTGYTCADLFFQESLLRAAIEGLQTIADHTEKHPAITAVVGVPVVIASQMYNCGAVVSGGRVRGLVPKTYLPNYSEFYERRWFSSSEDLPESTVPAAALGLAQQGSIPVGRDLLFTIGDGTVLGVEICEDLWTPMPPSTLMALNGAEVIVNLSASNETVGKREYRRDLVRHQSSICRCVYGYCSAGCTESTQDLVFSGHSLVAESGSILAENTGHIATDYLLVQDADLGKIRAARRQNKSVKDAVSYYQQVQPMRSVDCRVGCLRSDGMLYKLNKLPFVPFAKTDRLERCLEIFNIQVAGLKQRLAILDAKAVIGISGGLDSTLALLVAVEAMRQLGRSAADIHGVTMPCFGTSDRTYRNAWELMNKLGVTGREIDIKNAVTAHFRDIGYAEDRRDATYENAQARERTQVLMDYAGAVGGIVVGTGDLSELALGWCTYNGDQMSMYGVNASVPKTLIRWMVLSLTDYPGFAAARGVLLDVLDTPISPELLPLSEGEMQQTEDILGPYALHDFFLYYMVRCGYAPKKIYTLACRAFRDEFEPAAVKKWLVVFYRRFFTQQFKRSCMPDGVKVGSVCLNPRGDWRMPSDAVGRVWLEEAENL
ncbi:MAG: NAD(+) synthase [Oscillospiraceae bacterium]|nr:NAD(+) synthase [Oscillospiraceae bacterium]MBQ9929677.1 NAD(+) synthase [Oscillospiraceae bacterium]